MKTIASFYIMLDRATAKRSTIELSLSKDHLNSSEASEKKAL